MFWTPGKHGEILSEDSYLSINFDVIDKYVLILGSGGSAQTAKYTLSDNNKVYIVSRNKKDGDLTYSDLNEIAGDVEVIINTTPLGMPPYENEKLPMSLLNFSKLELFYLSLIHI